MGFRLYPPDQFPETALTVVELWYDKEGLPVPAKRKDEAAGSVRFWGRRLSAPMVDNLNDQLVTARKGGKADINQGRYDRLSFLAIVRKIEGFEDVEGTPYTDIDVKDLYDMIPAWMRDAVLERFQPKSLTDDERGN